jgi:ribA/ribD-fused uncharacterized protein
METPNNENEDIIKFFGRDGPFAIFSNFAYTPLVIDDLNYKTAEHYFQSMKFIETDYDYAETVRNASSPKEAKRLGCSKEHRISRNWNSSERIIVMERVLICKALQHDKFRELLLSTGDREIIEASWDTFWGEGKSGNGENMMGKLLMELRNYLRR